MINSLLKTALARPVLIMLLTLLLASAGLWQASRLPVDAVPDITNVQVQINTAAEGFSPQETEQRITYA
ncbi:MAG: efflux RND transporter permease subunit, partial [Pararheinheimera sp.]|nr:efflux RND transporter permease subunit [Rheinheimera sp.]